MNGNVTMKMFGLVGWSGSGKTTLMKKLLPVFIERGLRVSTLKHTHHNVDIDQPGKDSYEHRRAGAYEVMLSSSARWSLTHELRDESEPDVAALAQFMAPVDLLLIEGFKNQKHDKIEIYRAELKQELLCVHDTSIVAVVTDDILPDVSIPVFSLNDVDGIADFIMMHGHLAVNQQSGKANG